MGFHDVPWFPQDYVSYYYTLLELSISFHELPCCFMTFHKVPWVSIGFLRGSAGFPRGNVVHCSTLRVPLLVNHGCCGWLPVISMVTGVPAVDNEES